MKFSRFICKFAAMMHALTLAWPPFLTARGHVIQRIGPRRLAWQRGVYALALLALIGSAQAYTRIGGIARNSATQITAGLAHACALTTSGVVQCWGANLYGALGTPQQGSNFSDTPRSPPVIASGIVAISAGVVHTCALNAIGWVQCWGDNWNGQLGSDTGNATSSFTPLLVSGLNAPVIAIAAGGFHSCALTSAGGVWCWGANADGELGNGSTFSSNMYSSKPPTAVVGLPAGVVAITAGNSHTCALTANGAVWCWGDNNEYQLGNTGGKSAVPVAVAGLPAVMAITAGDQHNCALTTTGGVQCWGRGAKGNLGNGSILSSATPATVTGLSSGVSAIGSGQSADHTCAVQNGSLWCWGNNDYGQLGNGSTSTSGSNVPVQVSGLYNGAVAVAASHRSTFLLTTAGGIQSWGYGVDGELGDGSITFGDSNAPSSTTPVSVAGFIPLDPGSISAGEYHSCVLTKSGTPFCWGLNDNGQLGINTQHSPIIAPAAVSKLSYSLSGISLGGYHTCGVITGGAVTCWGYNGYGGLGNGSTTDSATPVWAVGLSSGISSVAAGLFHSCALTTAGNVRCWGYNNDGQVGNGHNANISTPAMVLGINSGVYGITAGGYHTCTINSGWFPSVCWGYNGYGQLGNNSTTDSNTPVFAWNLPSGLTSVSAGGYHTCAVAPSGAAQCWGDNGYGQLGNGSLANSSVPTTVSGLSSGASAISAGAFHTCALTSSGTVQCWGNNSQGQLGNGGTSTSATPVSALNDAVAVAAGGWHSCAITGAAGVQCWGYDVYGELGNGHVYSSTNNPPNYSASRVIAVYAGQAVTFTPPSSAAHGTSVALSASATSGLPVSFDTWTPSTCSISGSTLSLTGSGLCGVRASQSGWMIFGPYGFAAAPQQLRLIQIQ